MWKYSLVINTFKAHTDCWDLENFLDWIEKESIPLDPVITTIVWNKNSVQCATNLVTIVCIATFTRYYFYTDL